MVGRTISYYKVLEKIGQRGMGEVYRATDTKPNRDVTLRILPKQLASDSQRMVRFQREAELLSSLDHPNIGQIYGITSKDNLRFKRVFSAPKVCHWTRGRQLMNGRSMSRIYWRNEK